MLHYFPATYIRNARGHFPMARAASIRSHRMAAVVTFKGDPGYVKIKTEEGSEQIDITPYGNKSSLKRNPADITFNIGDTVDDFLTNGPNMDRINVEHELSKESLNIAMHLMRIFAGNTNTSGGYSGRTSILS